MKKRFVRPGDRRAIKLVALPASLPTDSSPFSRSAKISYRLMRESPFQTSWTWVAEVCAAHSRVGAGLAALAFGSFAAFGSDGGSRSTPAFGSWQSAWPQIRAKTAARMARIVTLRICSSRLVPMVVWRRWQRSPS
jgi:hypothetical protein